AQLQSVLELVAIGRPRASLLFWSSSMAGYTRLPDEQDDVDQLRRNVGAGKIPQKNLSFVQSLIDQSKGGLTTVQMQWVAKWNKFALDGTNPWTGEKPAPVAPKVERKIEPAERIGTATLYVPLCRRLIDLFKATELSQPKLMVKSKELGVVFKFTRLGQ